MEFKSSKNTYILDKFIWTQEISSISERLYYFVSVSLIKIVANVLLSKNLGKAMGEYENFFLIFLVIWLLLRRRHILLLLRKSSANHEYSLLKLERMSVFHFMWETGQASALFLYQFLLSVEGFLYFSIAYLDWVYLCQYIVKLIWFCRES